MNSFIKLNKNETTYPILAIVTFLFTLYASFSATSAVFKTAAAFIVAGPLTATSSHRCSILDTVSFALAVDTTLGKIAKCGIFARARFLLLTATAPSARATFNL